MHDGSILPQFTTERPVDATTTAASPAAGPSPSLDTSVTTRATTANSVRPSLARSDRGDVEHDGSGNGDDDDSDNEDNLLTLTAYDIKNEMEEVNLEQVLDEYSSCDATNVSKDPSASVATGQKQYWIDAKVEGDLEKALPLLLQKLWQPLRLTKFLKRQLQDVTQWQIPQVLPLQKAVWIVMRILESSHNNSYSIQDGDDSDNNAASIRHAAALSLPTVFVTVTVMPRYSGGSLRRRKATSLWRELSRRSLRHDESISRMLEERELPEKSVSGCVVVWLGYHVARTQALASALRNRVYALVEKTDDILYYRSEIVGLKDTLLRLDAVAEEQAEGIQAVAEGDAVSAGLTFDSSIALQGALRVVGQSAASTERTLTRLEKRVADLEHAYDAAQQSTINGRLQALTILSAVFLPLTLMAGVWGMNFTNMPELNRENAYYFALASMAAVACGLLSFFYQNGWLARV